MKLPYALRNARRNKVLIVKVEGGAFNQYREEGDVFQVWRGGRWKEAEAMRRNREADWFASERKVKDYLVIKYRKG